jgi:ATP-dependent Zn protease
MNRISWTFCALAMFATTGVANARMLEVHDVPLSFVEEQLTSGNVKRVDVEHDQLSGELAAPRSWDGKSVEAFRTTLPEGTTAQWNFTQWLLANRHDAIVNVRNQSNLVLNILVPLIPWVLIFGFIWFTVFRQLRSQQKAAYTGDALRVHVVNPTPVIPVQSPLPPPPLQR